MNMAGSGDEYMQQQPRKKSTMDSREKQKKSSPIKVKEDPRTTILKHASDDVLALAIRGMMKKK